MPVPFAEVVGGPVWRAEAESWVRDRLAAVGATVTGDITQPRIRPWSTQLVAPTDRGTAWFKANCPALAFEPAVHATLARLDPAEVDVPLATDAERGWLLTRDRGATLGDSREPTLEDWQRVVTTAAGLQRRLAGHGADLIGAGLPDCSPATVPGRFEAMVGLLAALPPEHPSSLSAAAAARLRGGRDAVELAAATLSDPPMPPTLQHGDLHPTNVFVVDGALRIFDFGDAQWAHPLEILAVPWGWLTQVTSVPWPEVLAAYASAWADVVSPRSVSRLLPAAMVTHAVNRSWTWWGATAEATPEELAEWGRRPRHFLELAFEPFAATGDPSAADPPAADPPAGVPSAGDQPGRILSG